MNKRGFTLIEILVVIIVIGLLAALVGPRIIGRVSEAKNTTARTQIELLGLALDNYRLDNRISPTARQGVTGVHKRFQAVHRPVHWDRPHVQKATSLDAHG